MFNIEKAAVCLRGVVGFEQSYNNEIPNIDDDLSSSSSGLKIGASYHPLLSYENITAIAQNFSQTVVKAWAGTVQYRRNDVVKVGVDIYYAKRDNLNQPPATSPDDWGKTTLLSAYLRKLYEASSIKLLHSIFTKKSIAEASKQLLGNVLLYEGQGNIYKRIDKGGRFAGLRITLKHPDTVAMLSKIGLQLSHVQSDVKIYLFHSSSVEPIKVWTINHTKATTFQWHIIELETMSFLDDNVNAGGHYYIGYFEDELTGQAINKEMKFDGTGCATCTEAVVNRQLYNKWGKFVTVQPFYVTGFTGEMWDEEQEMYVDTNTWGINLQMAVQCDVSRLLCSHANGMADALAKQLTVDLLQEMTFSMRDNQLKNRVAQLAAVALDNQENGQMGQMKMLTMAINAIDFNFSDLSPMCNPCNDGRSQMRKTSIWG